MAASSAPAGRASRVESFFALTVQHFANDSLGNYLPGILVAVAVSRGLPVFLLGGLATALRMGQVLQPAAGIAADAVGGRMFILVAPLMALLGMTGVSFLQPYPLLLASLFVTGLGSALFHPQGLACARSLMRSREGSGMSLFLVGGELGRAVGPLAAGVVVAVAGLNHLWLMGVIVLVSIPFALHSVPLLERRRRPLSLGVLLKHGRPALTLLMYSSFRSTAVLGITVFMPLLWHARGGTVVGSAALVSVFIGIGVIGNVSGGLLADRLGGKPILYGAPALACALALCLTFVNGVFLWVAIALLGIALFSTMPITVLIGQDMFPESRALGSSVAAGLANSMGGLLLLPVAYVGDHLGLTAGLFLVAASLACAVGSVPFVFRIGLKGRDVVMARTPRAD